MILVFYLIKLFPNRTVLWRTFSIKLRRSVGQGSPLSVFYFVIFFDYSPKFISLVSFLCFADDSNYLLKAKTWLELESEVEKLMNDFAEWATLNEMEINVTKTKIIFFDRRSSTISSSLSEYVVSSHRVLGVYIDARLSFGVHMNFLSSWVASRSYILARLRTFGVSEPVLLRLALSFRMRLIYGSWWIFFLSGSQFKKLESLWSKLVKKSMGFYRNVENRVVFQFCGVDSLDLYLTYWFTIRSCEYKLKGLVDFFSIYENFKKKFCFKKSRCRPSTTDKTFNLYFRKKFYLPETIITWFKKISRWRERCFEIFASGKYKITLKREMLSKIIHKNTIVKKEVAKINQKFKEKYI